MLPLTIENVDEESSNMEMNGGNLGNSSKVISFYDQSQAASIWTEPKMDAIITTLEPVLLNSYP